MLIATNAVIRWFADDSGENRRERILWVSPDRSYLYTFDLNRWEEALPVRWGYEEIVRVVRSGRASVTTYTVEYYCRPDSDYTEPQIACRDRRWAVIEPIVTAGGGEDVLVSSTRGPMVENAWDATGHAKRVIYGWLRRWWYAGQIINALIPLYHERGTLPLDQRAPTEKKLGRPFKAEHEFPGVTVDPEMKVLLCMGYKKYFLNFEGEALLTEAHQKTLEEYFRTGETVDVDGVIKPDLPHQRQLPTLRQFAYHCHTPRSRQEILEAREGESRVAANYAPKVGGGSALQAFGPGAWFYTDSTKAACLIVDTYNRAIELGTPTLYFVKDLFSSMITGFLVTLEEASWLAQVLALETTVRDKVKVCAEYGITITEDAWPCHYLPAFLLTDRGEGESSHASNLPNILGVQISNTPPFRPDMKGTVELDFSLLKHYALRRVPGGGDAPHGRGVPDRRGTPCVTLDELTYVTIAYILHYNATHMLQNYPVDNVMIADEIDPVPLKLWRWGVANRSGSLRAADPQFVYESLLPRVEARVSQYGIEYEGLIYDSTYAIDHDWLLKSGHATGKGSIRPQVAYDSRTTNMLLLIDNNQVVDRCALNERCMGYANIAWSEYRAIRKEEATRGVDLQNDAFHSRVQLNARIDHVVEPAKAAADEARKEAGMPKRASTKGRRDQLKKAREQTRHEDTDRRLDEMGVKLPEGDPDEKRDQTSGTPYHYVPPQTYDDLIEEDLEESDESD